ncbi:MAG: hypothetical protein HFH49_10035 [Lachnospiraceae bacterium]|nr:hypothetical protein [Lachnospiraceae bacterium]
MDSRTKNSARNIFFSELSYAATLILQFANRSFFIRFLPAEYLSLNGLFSNILSFLSLAELGFGSAINFALYKPLKEQDTETLSSIMALYRRFYTFTGLAVLISGSALLPILPCLIKEPSARMSDMYLYFLLYLANSGASYFYSCKRSLMICDQKEYIVSIITSLFHITLKILQILALALFQSYTVYLSLLIAATLLQNIVITALANRMYPFLKEKKAKKLDPQLSADIKKNAYALVFQKIGVIIVYATDNLIISKFVSFASVGIYSNYTLVVQAVQTAAYRFFDSITASIGDFAAVNESRDVKKVLYRVLFINAWMFCFCSVCLLCLLQPFIRLWIGENYLLSGSTLAVIILNFYLEGMRATLVTFKRAIGLFWQTRYRPILEGMLNLAVSIPLAVRFGIAGTLLGTIISTCCMSGLAEPYLLFRSYFQEGFLQFMLCHAKYAFLALTASCLTYFGCSLIKLPPLTGFLARICLCLLIPNLFLCLIFRKNENYLFLKAFAAQLLKKKFRTHSENKP